MKLRNLFKYGLFFRKVTKAYCGMALGVTFCIILSSCHSSRYFSERAVNLKTPPNATIFWEDGRKAASADSSGYAKLMLSESMYRKGKKKIIVAKAGYEPQTVSFRKKFNRRVLYNLFFPPAFLWGHYATISFKKTNDVGLTTPSEHDAITYLSMADDVSSKKKKAKLLKKAMFQDPDNAEGLAVMSTNKLSELYYDKKDYDDAYFWAVCGNVLDENDAMSIHNCQRAETAIKEKAERKRRRAETWGTILSIASMGMATASNIMSIGKSSALTTTNYSGSSSKSGNSHNYQASYNVWAKQAENLYKKLKDKNGYTGNSKTRTVDVQAFHKAQREMRSISLKAAHAGKPVQKSFYETADL